MAETAVTKSALVAEFIRGATEDLPSARQASIADVERAAGPLVEAIDAIRRVLPDTLRIKIVRIPRPYVAR